MQCTGIGYAPACGLCATPIAAACFGAGITIVDPSTGGSSGYERRLLKYHSRGFSMVFPSLAPGVDHVRDEFALGALRAQRVAKDDADLFVGSRREVYRWPSNRVAFGSSRSFGIWRLNPPAFHRPMGCKRVYVCVCVYVYVCVRVRVCECACVRACVCEFTRRTKHHRVEQNREAPPDHADRRDTARHQLALCGGR